MANLDAKTLYSKAESLIENWSERIDLVEEVCETSIPFERKVVLAQCLENTQQAINMLEATNAGDTSGFKHFALDLVTAVIPNLVANDLVSIQPIDHEVGVINYIRYLYGNTKGNAVQGQEFASGILYTGSDTYYSSQEVVGEGMTVSAEKTQITGMLSWKPVLPGTVKINGVTIAKEGQSVVVDLVQDKAGAFKAFTADGAELAGVVASGATNTATGETVITLAEGCTIESTIVSASYQYDNKSIGNGAIGTNAMMVPEVDIKIETMPVVCQSRKLKALYAFDAAFKLQKEYGADINTLLSSQIAAEIAHEIDGEIMNDLYLQAGLVNEAWNAVRPEGISLREHYESFYANLVVGSNKIFGATKRAQANFLIVGLDVASVLEVMPTFVPSGAKNVIGPHIAGTIGNMTVVKNPYYPSKAYLLGYKGLSLFDAGLTVIDLMAA